MNNFTYIWKLEDLKNVEKNNLKVFSCFACGGGSTMGYKMSGFDVIGCNEIDPEMAGVYKTNHNPKLMYVEDIRIFNGRTNLPHELYHLDILDGSPPCSSFSMSGSRESGWGINKKFREGQKDQVLDDLFFEFIKTVDKLKPRVVVAENVKGMIQGNAKGYVKEIISCFKNIGYDVQLFLLNGAMMGLPQRRERVFFICKKNKIFHNKLVLNFNERQVIASEAFIGCRNNGKDMSNSSNSKYWEMCKPGKSFSSVHPTSSLFNSIKLSPNAVANTLPASGGLYHWEKNRLISKDEACRISSFPSDFKFKSDNAAIYQMGMSVPPLMMHKISEQIYLQWFKNDKIE